MKKTFTNLALIALFLLSHFSMANSSSFSLESATIGSIHQAMKQQRLTCEELVRYYLLRIKRYNLSISPRAPINAFTQINPNVMSQARQLDDAYAKNRQFSGSLHCIPVVIKDNIDSYDSITTSGTLALLGNQPNQDAFLVAQLRQAGAIILGKSGMDELASGMFGLSSRSGRIGNAYHPEKSPGGSSGGSAVAVSADFAVLSIGTDNSGSVRIPAAFNGVYGLRPSSGLISQRGIFPAGNLDGTAGPMARTVQDLARLLDVVAREDVRDQKTVGIPRVKTYTTFLNEKGLVGKRIGIVRLVGQINPFKNMPSDITQLLAQSLEKMKKSGAVIVDDIQLKEFNNNRNVNMAGMRRDIDAYLASYPAVRKNAADMCQSNRTHIFGSPERCMKFFKSMPIKFGKEYQEALQTFQKNKAMVERVMDQHQLDALLIPISTTGVATYDPFEVNTWQAVVSSNAGLPSITINMGYAGANKMPVGVELIARQFAEGTLIEMAYAHEKNSSPRLVPLDPEKNSVLEKLDIAQYNNFITKIGYASYMDVLKKIESDEMSKKLTPDVFKAIVSRELTSIHAE